MNVSEYRQMLKDSLIYNIHYAPNYPPEDRTDLDQQLGEIRRHFLNVRKSLRADYKLKQLDLAEREVETAFDMYESGQDGREHFEGALSYIERSKAKKPPTTDFVVGPDGQTRGT